MSATRNVPSTEVCRPRKSPATFGSAPPSSRHTRYDARPRVKVTGVLSPERGPRDTKVRGVVSLTRRRDTARYRSFPQTYGIETRWGIERVLRRNGLNQVNPVHLRDRVAFCVAGPATNARPRKFDLLLNDARRGDRATRGEPGAVSVSPARPVRAGVPPLLGVTPECQVVAEIPGQVPPHSHARAPHPARDRAERVKSARGPLGPRDQLLGRHPRRAEHAVLLAVVLRPVGGQDAALGLPALERGRARHRDDHAHRGHVDAGLLEELDRAAEDPPVVLVEAEHDAEVRGDAVLVERSDQPAIAGDAVMALVGRVQALLRDRLEAHDPRLAPPGGSQALELFVLRGRRGALALSTTCRAAPVRGTAPSSSAGWRRCCRPRTRPHGSGSPRPRARPRRPGGSAWCPAHTGAGSCSSRTGAGSRGWRS